MKNLFSTIPFAALLMATLLFSSMPASAGLKQMNDANFGAGLDGFNITYDSATRTKWLDLTLTIGYSADSIVTQFGPSGIFEGYRLATTPELFTLFEHAGVRDLLEGKVGQEALDPSFNAAVSTFLDLFGRTDIRVDSALSRAFFNDGPNSDGSVGAAYIQEYTGARSNTRFQSAIFPNGAGRTVATTTRGAFLVKVPEPGMLAIFGLGLLGMALTSRRRHVKI